MTPPIRTVHVTYDGALDPLGGSQVVPYLRGLANRGVSITLVSFEKRKRWNDAALRSAVADQLAAAGIRWRPLRYHHVPRVPATLWDIWRGARVVAAENRHYHPHIIHCRGDIATLMARRALTRIVTRPRLVQEVRGLFSEERREIGSWRSGSWLDRAVRSVELQNLREADGVLAVMSEAGLEALRKMREPLPPHRLMPNSVDLDAFTPRPDGEPAEFGLAYCGSLGGWYMTEEMIAFARVASQIVPGRVLFLTPQADKIQRTVGAADWVSVASVRPGAVPFWLRKARATFFMVRPTPAKRASSPTKLAESLALGLPVVANPGVGDIETVLEPERVGVLVAGFNDEAYREAATRLAELVSDPAVSGRCRKVAETRYDLRRAVNSYCELYDELLKGRP